MRPDPQDQVSEGPHPQHWCLFRSAGTKLRLVVAIFRPEVFPSTCSTVPTERKQDSVRGRFIWRWQFGRTFRRVGPVRVSYYFFAIRLRTQLIPLHLFTSPPSSFQALPLLLAHPRVALWPVRPGHGGLHHTAASYFSLPHSCPSRNAQAAGRPWLYFLAFLRSPQRRRASTAPWRTTSSCPCAQS
jgi:hypothetical protein